MQHQGCGIRNTPHDKHALELHRFHRMGQAWRRIRRYFQLLVATLRPDVLSCKSVRSVRAKLDTDKMFDSLTRPSLPRKRVRGSRHTSRHSSRQPTRHCKDAILVGQNQHSRRLSYVIHVYFLLVFFVPWRLYGLRNDPICLYLGFYWLLLSVVIGFCSHRNQ